MMSRILNRQRQLAEQGRLRLGLTTPASNGKSRPKASTTVSPANTVSIHWQWRLPPNGATFTGNGS